MSALIILLVLSIWSALLYNAGYYATFAIERKWTRQAIGITTVIAVTTLVLWDEVAGTREFERLCTSGGVYQIAPEAIGKKFDLKYMSTEPVALKTNVRPVEEITITYTDVITGKVVAKAKAYLARPGWLVRNRWLPSPSGGTAPLIGRPQCFPGDEPGQSKSLHAITNKVLN